MIEKKEVRKNLRSIKYYFARKSSFDTAFKDIVENDIVSLTERYNNILKKAPAILFDIYVSLYLKNFTQETLADKTCYSRSYIYKLNTQLIDFITEELNKWEKANETNVWIY